MSLQGTALPAETPRASADAPRPSPQRAAFRALRGPPPSPAVLPKLG